MGEGAHKQRRCMIAVAQRNGKPRDSKARETERVFYTKSGFFMSDLSFWYSTISVHPPSQPPIHFCLRCWVFCRGELWKGEKWDEWGTTLGLYFLHEQSQQKRQWALQHSGFNASVLPCRDQNPKLIKLNSDEEHSCLRSATKQSANYLN